MALTISSRIVMRGIGCILIILMSSAQAIDYDVYRNNVISTPLKSNVIFTSRDFLEELILVAPKENTSQEATEYLLHFGALLRTQILDIIGNLLYIYYDDFSVAEVEALHKVYQEIFERRYDIFGLVTGILENAENMRPSKICAAIYAHAESCLRSSANVCRRIRKQHDLPHPEDLDTSTINVTHAAYHLSKVSKLYPRGFSPTAVLKLLQREVLTITPALLSGLLYNVRYDDFDDDVRFAENKLVQYFREVKLTTKNSSNTELQPLSTRKLKKLHTVNSFLKYYIMINAKRFSEDDLKKYSLLIMKRIADDIGTINENIYLLGNVYEKHMIHVEYLFDLVLPDDTLDDDVIEAKKYLVRKLYEFNVIEKYLKVQRYQQATPGQLTMEITSQLTDIGFAEEIAKSLRMHAKFWRRNTMIENLDELLGLFDAYENLRQIPEYHSMMQNIDKIKENLWDKKNVTVEILCNAPRACLRIGLQSILRCKHVNPEIKNLIKTFLLTSNMCAITIKKSMIHIPIKFSKLLGRKSTILATETTTEAYDQSKITTDSFENESTEEIPGKLNMEPLEDSLEFIRIPTIAATTAASMTNDEYDYSVLTTATTDTTDSEEETTVATSTVATTTTASSVTTTTTSPTTEPTTTTTILPTTTTTESPTTTSTSSPTTTTTILPTTTTTESSTTTSTSSPTTTTTILPTTTTTESLTTPSTSSPTIITTTLPTTTTTILPTTTTTELSTTTSTSSPTTITTTSPTTTTTILPTTITTELSTTTSTSSPTTITTTSLTTTTTILPTTTTELPTTTSTSSPTTTTTTLATTTTTILPTTTITELPTTTSTSSPTTTTTTLPTTTTTVSPTTTTTELSMTTSTSSPTTTTTVSPTTITTESLTTTTTESLTTTTTESPTTTTTSPTTTEEISITKESSSSAQASTAISCESNECTTEKNSKEATEPIETTTISTLTTTSTIQPLVTSETIRTTSSISSTETAMVMTDDKSSTPVTRGDDCKRSCSEECRSKNENNERSEKSCETDCDSLMEDCNKDSPETSSECTDIDKSCKCVSKEDKSTKCPTLCLPEENAPCSQESNDCSTSSTSSPTNNLTIELIRQHSLCEIRDPHRQRQIKRLAKMRAISVAAATNAFSSGIRPSRIATKKQYNLLASKQPHFKSEKSKKEAKYLLKKPLSSVKKVGSRKRRTQQEQIHRLRKKLTKKLRRKKLKDETSAKEIHQS